MENTENKEPEKKSIPQRIKDSFQLRHIIGLAIGGIGGFLYYYFVGCQSGACALKSNPFYNIVLGLLLGYLIADMIKFKNK